MRLTSPTRVTIAGAVFSIAIIATATQCRTPTQVIIEVSTNAPCDDRLDTAIFVGKTSAADVVTPIVTRRGCEREGFIGSAVLLPSGADDDAFAIKVITAIDARMEDCMRGTSNSCITERRALRYDPNAIVRVGVYMDRQCAGVRCAPRETCQRGACVACADCVDPTLVEAGAPDAPPPPTTPDGSDVDAEILAGPCNAPCTSCAGGTCVIDCSSPSVDCKQGITCPEKRRCEVRCNKADGCTGTIDCGKAVACDVTCETGNNACSGVIDCGKVACRVRCLGPGQKCNSLEIRATNAKSLCLQCIGPDKVCNSVAPCEAVAKTCSRNCSGCNDPNYCPGCTDLVGAAECPAP